MSSQNSSQCQLFQLHIDALLDHELEPSREAELRAHLAQCSGCSAELAYAEALHRAVVDLPLLDCSDQALEPVDRLFAASDRRPEEAAGSFWSALGRLIESVPVAMRFGIPAAAVVLLVIALGPFPGTQEPAQEVAATLNEQPSGAPSGYTEVEIRQALQDLELAIDYLGRISERTEAMIGDRFLRQQLEESIKASLRDDRRSSAESQVNGPI